eukprot:11044411-Lingulodinium_polyedra.AAC.1
MNWPRVGHGLATSWPCVVPCGGHDVAMQWTRVGRALATRWPCVGHAMAMRWPRVGRAALAARWPRIGRGSTSGIAFSLFTSRVMMTASFAVSFLMFMVCQDCFVYSICTAMIVR